MLVLGALLGACKTPEGARAPTSPSVEDPEAPASEAPDVGEAAPPTGAAGAGTAAPGAPPTASGPSLAPAPTAAAPAAPERHGPPLPELGVKSFGLHVGGGAKDAAARDDFLRALERAKGRYFDCYRLIDEPGSVGTFGADLTVGGDGGKPRVGKPRTKLRGDEFQSCMVRAFESVTFGRPPSGRSVVVSYSVKFSFTD
jgi:hypothetical protein